MSLEQQSALLAQLKDYPAPPHLAHALIPSASHHLASQHTFNPLQQYSTAHYPFPSHDELPHLMMLQKHALNSASASASSFPVMPSHSTASDSQYAHMLQQFLRDGRANAAAGVEYGRDESGSSRSAEEESEGELSELSSDDVSGSEEGSGRQRQLGRQPVKRELRTSSHQPTKRVAHPVITVTSPPKLTASASASVSALTTPVRPTAQPKSSLVRPPSIRIPPPSIVTNSATAPGQADPARSPLTPWSPFTPLSPITPITPVTPQQSHQPAAALSSSAATPAASHLLQLSAATPSAVHLMPSHPPMVAPLSQSDMSPSSRFILPQPSPLFQQHSYPQTPSTYFSSSALLAESSFLQHTPSTPALFHQSSSGSNTSASSPAFRNPFSSTPAPLLQSLSMPIGLSPMQSPFQSSNSHSPYPFPSMSPPAVSAPPRPLPSELIVNPHLATSSSAPTSTTSATSSSASSTSSTTSRKRKLAATLPSSTSEDDSDSDSEDASGSGNPSSEPVHNCPFTACTKSFLKPSALKRHVRTHTGERPFVCSVSGCGLSFAERGNLKRHERVHSGLKPFRCDMCGHDFARRCHLMQHLKAKHPNMLLEE